MVSKQIEAIALAAGLVFGGALPPSAAAILDQSNIYDPGFAGPAVVTAQSLAQTFTTGKSGLLRRIELQLYKNTGTSGDLILDIRRVIGNAPDSDNSNALLSMNIGLDLLPTRDLAGRDWVPNIPVTLTSIDVAGAAIFVQSGDQFALTLRRNAQGTPPWVIWSNGADTYGNGSEYYRASQTLSWLARPNSDMGFQVHILEPATFALMGLGLAGIGYRKYRSNITP